VLLGLWCHFACGAIISMIGCDNFDFLTRQQFRLSVSVGSDSQALGVRVHTCRLSDANDTGNTISK
jgi:hypothetical protein